MTRNKLLNFVNRELSKDAAKIFKLNVMAKLEISGPTFYRRLNEPSGFSQIEKEAVAALANKEVNELFENLQSA